MTTREERYITVVRGDSLSFGMEFMELEGALDEAAFSVRTDPEAEECAAESTLNNGITMNDNSHYVVRLAPEQTAALEIGKYWYDLYIRAGEDAYTLMRGVLEIVPNIS